MNTTGKKYGGREKGTPNKLTSELRNILKEIISTEIEALPEALKGLEAKERLEIIIKLLPYVLPKEIEQLGFEQDIKPMQFQIINMDDTE